MASDQGITNGYGHDQIVQLDPEPSRPVKPSGQPPPPPPPKAQSRPTSVAAAPSPPTPSSPFESPAAFADFARSKATAATEKIDFDALQTHGRTVLFNKYFIILVTVLLPVISFVLAAKTFLPPPTEELLFFPSYADLGAASAILPHPGPPPPSPTPGEEPQTPASVVPSLPPSTPQPVFKVIIEGVLTNSITLPPAFKESYIYKSFPPLLWERARNFFSVNLDNERTFKLVLGRPTGFSGALARFFRYPGAQGIERDITAAHGYFREELEIPASSVTWTSNSGEPINFDVIDYNATKIHGSSYFIPSVPGDHTVKAKKAPFAAIVDIDDTLKPCISHSPFQAAKHHIAISYTPLPGSVRQLQKLAKKLVGTGDKPHERGRKRRVRQDKIPMRWYYLGAAPTGLAKDLLAFLRQYPPGELLLNKFMLSGEGSLLDYADFRSAKTRQIATLLSRLPNRKFVLIGDNAISDAPVYFSFLGLQPDRIACILIKRVPSPSHPTQQKEGNAQTRNDTLLSTLGVDMTPRPAFESVQKLREVFREEVGQAWRKGREERGETVGEGEEPDWERLEKKWTTFEDWREVGKLKIGQNGCGR